MDKYKVILVDDEEEVIDVIERKIHWDMLGFDVGAVPTTVLRLLNWWRSCSRMWS